MFWGGGTLRCSDSHLKLNGPSENLGKIQVSIGDCPQKTMRPVSGPRRRKPRRVAGSLNPIYCSVMSFQSDSIQTDDGGGKGPILRDHEEQRRRVTAWNQMLLDGYWSPVSSWDPLRSPITVNPKVSVSGHRLLLINDFELGVIPRP